MYTLKLHRWTSHICRYMCSDTQATRLRYGGKVIRHPEIKNRFKVIEPTRPSNGPSYWLERLSKALSESHGTHKTKSPVYVLRLFLHRAIQSIHLVTCRMTSEVSEQGVVKSIDLSPPSSVRGMKVLNRDDFHKTIHVPGLLVHMKDIGTVSKALKDISLRIPAVKPWAELEDTNPDFSTHKVCLLDPIKFDGPESLTENQRNHLNKCNISLINATKLYRIDMCYKNWTYHEILKTILPEDSDGVAGFSIIGHIIHLNLRDAVMEYKHIIGEVLLDKIPSARTVINKLDIIDNTFRNFQMELLAGEDNLITVTKEHGLSYKLDFSKVYWNPRLGTEHQRVVDAISCKDYVYDVFAGIGPFSVPAAKKGCTVIANDLNPESYRWLKHNLATNKLLGDFSTYNLDGREFIRTVVREDLLKRWNNERSSVDPPAYHIVMNLPALAIEFLDAFQGLFDGMTISNKWKSFRLPKVHCYTFSKSDDVENDVRQRAESSLGATLPTESDIRFVRDVAPGKIMMCAVFTLQCDVLFKNEMDSDRSSPPTKRSKIDEVDEVMNC